MTGVLILTVTAFILAITLTIINYFLNKVDEEVEDTLKLLPGYNCGACGFGGCQGMAEQIVHNGVDPRKCRPMTDAQYEKITKFLKERQN